jgi:DNA gyrase subunit A
MERPDLTTVDPAVRAYIESLEAELEALRQDIQPAPPPAEEPLEPTEPPTTINLITVSGLGIAKRTPRHLYARQRRGGMGIFDLDTDKNDPPAFLTLADASQELVLLTSLARAFRIPVSRLPESPVRSRGASITAALHLREGETLAAVLPHPASGYIALVSRSGMVRCMRYHYFGENLDSDVSLYNYAAFGPLAAACWTPGEGDLFIATRQGRAIRFAAKQVSVQGNLGIRLEDGDAVVGVAAVQENSGVFMLGANGKGTIRLMAGFSPNKSPGAGGKTAINTAPVVGIAAVSDAADLFIISRLGKIIRFQAAEVPAKEGVVQGVNCMALRGDECVALVSQPL